MGGSESVDGLNPKEAIPSLNELASTSTFTGCVPAEVEASADELLKLAATHAVAPVSGFLVGAFVVGSSGARYLGANLEFAGAPIAATLHAEQSAIINAWMHGEHGIASLHVSEAPCGHCRQFLRELSNPDSVEIVFGGSSYRLSELIPSSFGKDRSPGRGLMDSHLNEVDPTREIDPFEQRAINAAQRSYAPYTHMSEGCAITCGDGHIFAGRAAESIAFNPGVTAMVAALNQRNLSGSRDQPIQRCVLTKMVSALQTATTLEEEVLRSVSLAPMEIVPVEIS